MKYFAKTIYRCGRKCLCAETIKKVQKVATKKTFQQYEMALKQQKECLTKQKTINEKLNSLF